MSSVIDPSKIWEIYERGREENLDISIRISELDNLLTEYWEEVGVSNKTFKISPTPTEDLSLGKFYLAVDKEATIGTSGNILNSDEYFIMYIYDFTPSMGRFKFRYQDGRMFGITVSKDLVLKDVNTETFRNKWESYSERLKDLFYWAKWYEIETKPNLDWHFLNWMGNPLEVKE